MWKERRECGKLFLDIRCPQYMCDGHQIKKLTARYFFKCRNLYNRQQIKQ